MDARFSRLCLFSSAGALLFFLPFAVIFFHGTIDGTDLSFYSGSMRLFAVQLWHGELYPRWLMDANSALGSPVFYFYPPVAAYLTSWLAPLSSVETTGKAALIISMGVAMLVSSLTFYAWLRARMPASYAFIGALIYELLPYRIEYTYLDFNAAQCWALAWFPLILLSADRLRESRPYAVPMLAGSTALLLMTHIPSSITFLPIVPLILFFETPRGERIIRLGQLFFCLLLGVALAAIYLLPFALNAGAVSPESMMGVQYDYAHNFASMAFIVTMPFVGALTIWIWWLSNHDERRQLLPWYGLMLLLIFMMTPLSEPVWDMFSPLRFLQFPVMRFYAPLLIVLAVIFTHAVTRLTPSKWFYALLVLYFLAHIGYACQMYENIRSWPKPRSEQVMAVMNQVDSTHITAAPEYRTRGTDAEFMTLPALAQWQQQNKSPIELSEGEGTVKLVAWEPRRIVVQAKVTSESGGQLTLYRFYFPGWSMQINGLSETPDLSASGYFGFMQLAIPKGNYTLTLTLDRVAGEDKGLFITLLALLVVALWVFKDRYQQRLQAEE